MATKVPRKELKKFKEQPAPVARRDWNIGGWLRGHARAALLALLVLATARIVATWFDYSHTSDEPGHVACGMEWLDKGAYTYEAQHPPLARVAVALGPYLAGIRSQGDPHQDPEGNRIIYYGGHYQRNLSLARLGVLPFFWLATLVVFVWARRALGDLEAVLAVFVFTFLPPVLAHAGLATTDMPLTALVGAAFLTGWIWLERPTIVHSLCFGAAVGLAVLAKFSALPFIPVSMAAALAWYVAAERPGFGVLLRALRSRLLPFGVAVAAGALVIWAGYRFSFGQVPGTSWRLPAPEFFAGIRQVMEHAHKGHSAYLLGQRSDAGWWYYYPVILGVKTPLPFLALLLSAIALYARKLRQMPRGVRMPLAFSLGILLFSLTSTINIGVRHVLPVYIGFSLVAAAGASGLMQLAARAAWARWTLALLLVWMAGTSLFAHPEYLPYFNALAGDEPEKIAVDSDLDWGQDMRRLGARLQELGAEEVVFNPFVLGYLVGPNGFGYPPIRPANPAAPSRGWNAVSLTVWKESRLGLFDSHPEVTPWPEKYKPTERIGKGIWLYYFAPR